MNLHTIALQQYIFYAPEHIQAQFANGYRFDSEQWRGNIGDCWFMGLLFRDNQVYAQNIYLFDAHNKYRPEYLNITETFNNLIKHYNIYHACIVAKSLLKKYYRESNLTENLIIYIKNDSPNLKPRFRYSITKHHSRERNFIISDRTAISRLWSKMLHQSFLHQRSRFNAFESLRGERPDSLYFTYEQKRELLPHPNPPKHRGDIHGTGKRVSNRKKRKRFGAYLPKSWRSDS